MMQNKISHSSQLVCATEYSVDHGKARGRYIEVSNGLVSFTLTVDNCLDISYFRHKGENISFIGKNGVCTQGDFEQTFVGGMLYTCGLENIGARNGQVTHGTIHSIPATITAFHCDEKSFSVTGQIRDARLFGRNLVLERTIFTEYKSGKVHITDTLENRGQSVADYALLYHMNLGYPMLDEGTKILADTVSSVGRTPFAKSKIASCFEMTAPVDEEEQVFFHTVKQGKVVVENGMKGLRVTYTYDHNALPCLVQWKSMVAGDYAMGIEPATCFLDDKFCYKQLKPLEKQIFELEIFVEEI